MLNSSTTSAVRVLPNNKVYRQLFDAQVQLSDAYNRTRNNQLTQSLNITTRPNGIPLVRNIRPHEPQKRQWLGSRPYSNDPSINPIAILFHDERKRRQNEQEKELDELKREVFNLPDDIEQFVSDTGGIKKGSVTERLASNRKVKFDDLWMEFLSKLTYLNQNLLFEMEKITRKCNTYYENGDQEMDDLFQDLIYRKEITTLTIKIFEDVFNQLDQFLPTRLAHIQELCQTSEELELNRIHRVRDLFKEYSGRLYRTHHLSDIETAHRLEKQANELNTQILDNRRILTELEAKLLAGETVRSHRSQNELINYQDKWRETTWIIQKQAWISKLSQCKSTFDSTVLSTCESIGSDVTSQTHALISHVNSLNLFIPPASTRNNARKWYDQGYEIVKNIVQKRQELVQKIKTMIDNEISLLKKEFETIRKQLFRKQVYNNEQLQAVLERDIIPLFEERKQYLQQAIIDRIELVYERFTHRMYEVLDRLLAFIQPAAEQWDDHQERLEHVMAQLMEMMREYRRPHDLSNEKKLSKLDLTLDEMRCASNEKSLTRLLIYAYEQLDAIKANYGQFYDAEHNIVNKYANMIAEEVNRYKQEMLDYFHARQIDANKSDSSSSSSHRYYITSLTQTTYELDGYNIPTDSNSTQQVSSKSGNDDEETRVVSAVKSSSDDHSHLKSQSIEQDPLQIQTFLTDEPTTVVNETNAVPFYEAFRIPSDLVNTLMINLRRAFLDYYDQWQEETVRRAEAVMFTKHEELEKEMDFQMHLHEPRRLRIETNIHNVRAGEIVMHEERVERHIRGVQETLEQTDAEYGRMFAGFGTSLNTYKEDTQRLEEIFLNAATTGALHALENRLKKQRNAYMEKIRASLRNFRQHFDEMIHYLRQANVKFRKSFKTFTEGGNFSREEMETHRKKLEKTMYQIDQAESMMFKEMEKLEKKQLEEANKIMNDFRERFKHHMADLQFIELTNRWISDTQVKIKSEVSVSNQQAQVIKTLVLLYQMKTDSMLNPNLDKQPATISEVRELFHQIVLATYERALYLKCLNNELMIPSSLIPILKEKGLITEAKLVNDLQIAGADEAHSSRRQSKTSAGVGSNNDEMKSVRFASSSSPTTVSSRHKRGSTVLIGLNAGQSEDIITVSTIQNLLHKNDQPESDEVAESGVPAATALFPELKSRPMVSSSSSESSRAKNKQQNKRQTSSDKDSSSEKATPAVQRERPSRAKTRDEIYAYYCTFGEKAHPGQDYLSKILNILRDSTEGILSHSEVFYKVKGFRPVTRPQALREKFDEFAELMIRKLKDYEQQCRAFHEQSINEFRSLLELFERISSLLAKIELDEQLREGEKVLVDLKAQFNMILKEKLTESNNEKEKNYDLLRPTFGHPARKNHLQVIDDQEKRRQEDTQQNLEQLQSSTTEYLQTNAQATFDALATSAERLLILFDDILTADEIIRTKLPVVRQSLLELIRRQQAGRPLEDSEPAPLLECKQGHWPGLPILDDYFNRRRESVASKKHSTSTSQRQKTSASIVTQKTTLPQIETIKQRDQVYQRLKDVFNQIFVDIQVRCTSASVDLDRYRTYWNGSIEKLHQLRTN